MGGSGVLLLQPNKNTLKKSVSTKIFLNELFFCIYFSCWIPALPVDDEAYTHRVQDNSTSLGKEYNIFFRQKKLACKTASALLL
jgi:hypothetical protein